MKILVPLKRVADPDNANKIKVTPAKIETTGLEWKPNPFDEYAVEGDRDDAARRAGDRGRQGHPRRLHRRAARR